MERVTDTGILVQYSAFSEEDFLLQLVIHIRHNFFKLCCEMMIAKKE